MTSSCDSSVKVSTKDEIRRPPGGSPHLFHFDGDATKIIPMRGKISKNPVRLAPRRVSEIDERAAGAQSPQLRVPSCSQACRLSTFAAVMHDMIATDPLKLTCVD